MTGSKVLNVLSLLQIAKLLPPVASRAPFSASRMGGEVLQAASHSYWLFLLYPKPHKENGAERGGGHGRLQGQSPREPPG